MRPPTAKDGDALEPAVSQCIKRVGDDVRTGEFVFGLGQYSRYVERNIAHANDNRMAARKIGVQIGEFGMAIVPPDKCRTADDILGIGSLNAQQAIFRRAGGENDRIVQ